MVVNTCGFIADAKEESINLLLSLAELKDSGKIGKIVAMGCLTQRYRDVLDKEIPEIDIVYGKFDWKNFIDSLEDRSGAPAPREWERTRLHRHIPATSRFPEGCDRFCAFCAIPLITGRHISRPMEEILEGDAPSCSRRSEGNST